MRQLLQDVRWAMRLWARRPGFAVVATLVIAFGIASATTVFSLVNAVLLHSLPYQDTDRLVLLWHQDLASGRDRITLSPAEYLDYSTQSQSFESLGAVRAPPITGEAARTAGPGVSALSRPRGRLN